MLTFSLLHWAFRHSQAAAVPTIVEQTFRILRTSSNGSGGKELQHVGFKVITQIMHNVHSSVYHFQDNQYRAMINMVRLNMEHLHSQNTSFALIKAMLVRKVMVPELYDLMSHCAQLMVTAHRPQVQKLCGQVFMKFVVDYPLSNKRRQQHLDELVCNLKYEYDSGRLSALKTFANVIDAWPVEALNEQCQTFFLHCTLRIANETNQACRVVLFKALAKLLLRVGSVEYVTLSDYVLQVLHAIFVVVVVCC